MRNYFTLSQKWYSGGVEHQGYSLDSRDYGVYISGAGTYSAPAQKYNVFPVPGRNGDIILPTNSYENGKLVFADCFIDNQNTGGQFEEELAAFRARLMRLTGYAKLRDSYHPGEYREVYNAVAFEPTVQPTGDAARFTIEFACKPQRWLDSGDVAVTLTASGETQIDNPTDYTAKPLIAIYGAGTLEWLTYGDFDGGLAPEIFITIDQAPPGGVPTMIDSQSMAVYYMDAYGSMFNWGSHVTLRDANNTYSSFPEIRHNYANVTFDDDTITQASVTPRWWTL